MAKFTFSILLLLASFGFLLAAPPAGFIYEEIERREQFVEGEVDVEVNAEYPLMKQLHFQAEYDLPCSELLNEEGRLYEIAEARYSDIQDVCLECSRPIDNSINISCADDITTITWPTSLIVPNEISLSQLLDKIRREMIFKKNLMFQVFTKTTSIVYPISNEEGLPASIYFKPSCPPMMEYDEYTESCVPVDGCQYQGCFNNGSCLQTELGYECYCQPSFTGRYCEEEVPPCFYQECRNNGSCTPTEYGYECSCPMGFAGESCEKVVSWEQEKSITDYLHQEGLPALTEITACFWLQAAPPDMLNNYTNKYIISMATAHSNWGNGFVLGVNSDGVIVFDIDDTHYFFLYDDRYQHLLQEVHYHCVVWKMNDQIKYYIDLDYDGVLQPFLQIPVQEGSLDEGATLIMMQEQDSFGGSLELGQVMVGSVGFINMWDYAMPYDELLTIDAASFGNIVNNDTLNVFGEDNFGELYIPW